MAWRWLGDKPLSEPMMAQFTDTYMSLGLNVLIESYIVNTMAADGLATKVAKPSAAMILSWFAIFCCQWKGLWQLKQQIIIGKL